jgi:hypothetical protein
VQGTIEFIFSVCILRVNRQLYIECMDILHNGNTFEFNLRNNKRHKTLSCVLRLIIKVGWSAHAAMLDELNELVSTLAAHNGRLKSVQVWIMVMGFDRGEEWSEGRGQGEVYINILSGLRKIRVEKKVRF